MHRTRVTYMSAGKLKNFIGGTFRAPATNRYLDNINPHTAQVINAVPASGVEDVKDAIAAASAAFPSWSQVPAPERASLLLRIADEIEKNAAAFALAESRDTGKPLTLATNVDVDRGVHNFRFFADVLLKREGKSYLQEVPQQARHHIVHRPVGVAALISPWNLPIYLLSWKIAPALAAGCTVVAKPSEFTPTTASLLAEAAVRAGLPAGVLNVVHGLGSDVGEELVGNAAVKAVSFTGGTTTGATVATVAAPHFKKISLELGGKNPAIILADADLDKAVAGVLRSSFLNSGQICLCSSRLLVHESLRDEFVRRLKLGVEGLKVGDPLQPDTDMGPVVSRAHLQKIGRIVDQAVSLGAQVVTGGPAALDPNQQACFYPPTILTGVQQDWDIVQEEVFGPVVTIQSFSSLSEALEMANGVKYGLAASVWTNTNYDLSPTNTTTSTASSPSNPRTQEVLDFTRQLDCGMVWVNCWLLRDLRVPFGGSKASGVGREGGEHSLEFFSEVSSICLAAPSPVPPLPGSMTTDSNNRTTAKLSTTTPAVTTTTTRSQNTNKLQSPVGKYIPSKEAGGLLFLAGIGPRSPIDNSIPGGPVRDQNGLPLDYDVEAQTRATIENVLATLESAGSSIDKIVDVQCFLIDMDRDFATFNKVYAEYFRDVNATRTCIAIRAMPSAIAVELKVVALP